MTEGKIFLWEWNCPGYIDDFHFKGIANIVIEVDNIATITAM